MNAPRPWGIALDSELAGTVAAAPAVQGRASVLALDLVPPRLRNGRGLDEPLVPLLIALGVAIWLAGRNLPAALLCLWPGLLRATETDDDGSLDPAREPAMERVHSTLERLGFAKIGAIVLRPPLSPGLPELVYGAKEAHSFADLNARGGSLRVTFFTPFEGGEAVITSNFRRPGRNGAQLLLGGLPNHDLAEIWAVHRRRIAQLVEGPRRATPWTDTSLAGRLRASATYVAGAGRGELRARGWIPLTVAAMALLLVALTSLELLRLR